MRKIAKLSLVAAVAVAGLTTTASAGALEDMIKNVDAFGYANIRYNSYDGDKSATASKNENSQTVYHKVVLGVTSKITDNISYTYAGAVTNSEETTKTGVAYTGGNFYTVYSNFTYTGIPGVTAVLGQQGINTPFTKVYDTYGGTQEGTGLALVGAVGPVNLVAAHFVNQNLADGDKFAHKNGAGAYDVLTAGEQTAVNAADLTAFMASTKLGSVGLDATYISLADIADGYSIGAKASLDLGVAKLSPYARYTALNFDNPLTYITTKDNALWYVGTGFKVGSIGGKLAYGQTDKDGGVVAVDNDAEGAFLGWNLCMNGTADAEMTQVQVNTNVLSNVNVAVQHDIVEYSGNTEDHETFVTVTYKPAKNFYAYVRGGVDKIGDAENTRGRIQLTYTF